MSCPRTAEAIFREPDFLAHAQGCAECGAQLERIEAVFARGRLPAPSAAALQRASAPILAELRAAEAAWAAVAAGGAAADQAVAAGGAAAGSAAAAGAGRATARAGEVRGSRVLEGAWWARPLLAGAAVAAFAIPFAANQGRAPDGWGAAIAVLAAAVALAWTAGLARAGALVAVAASAAFAFAEGGVPGATLALDGGGARCFFLELAAAALPLGAAAWMSRRSLRPAALAQAAAAGALAGQAALNLVCPGRADAAHLWAFHVAGVAAAALAGWIAGGAVRLVRGAA